MRISPGDFVCDGSSRGIAVAVDPTVTPLLTEGECFVIWAAPLQRSRGFERVPCLWLKVLLSSNSVKMNVSGVRIP